MGEQNDKPAQQTNAGHPHSQLDNGKPLIIIPNPPEHATHLPVTKPKPDSTPKEGARKPYFIWPRSTQRVAERHAKTAPFRTRNGSIDCPGAGGRAAMATRTTPPCATTIAGEPAY